MRSQSARWAGPSDGTEAAHFRRVPTPEDYLPGPDGGANLQE
jgi:hypothetical protein